MNQFERAFRPVFDSVCDDYGLSAASRAEAWDSCHIEDKNGHPYLDPYARDIYRMLAGTRPPYVACG